MAERSWTRTDADVTRAKPWAPGQFLQLSAGPQLGGARRAKCRAGTVLRRPARRGAVGRGQHGAPSWMRLLIPTPDADLPTPFFFF